MAGNRESGPVANVQRQVWKYLEPYATPLDVRRQDILYSPDQPAQWFYLLQAGQVSLQLLAPTGRALTLQVVDAGQVFGHSALMGNGTYDTFAEVVRHARVLRVPAVRVRELVYTLPELGILLLDIVGQYRHIVSRRLDEVAFKNVPARLASLLLEMAGTISDNVAGAAEAIHDVPLELPHRTHQQLAEMINAYRETVTKVINQFQDARLLDIDRSGITLLNVNGLEELARS